MALSLCLLFYFGAYGQTGVIYGTVSNSEGIVEFTSIHIEETAFSALTNYKGNYSIDNIPFGNYTLSASYLGFEPVITEVSIDAESDSLMVNFRLTERNLDLDAVVVTGTKTFKRSTNSAIIVNVLNSEAMENVQACNLAEGLKFQPGLRVETDCQTCNYTQLRMNGLGGGYAQILINGRPIFSPLTGLYGLEYLPVNLVDRIEVIRGGGSSLYGSSAVGGTVNVITRVPRKNSYEIESNYQQINGQASDLQFMGYSTLLSEMKNAGISLFLNKRTREFYDHNDDNYSEMPFLDNISLGANLFFLPGDNQKLEVSIANLNEYRLGGEMVDKPAYLAQQSEERTHSVWLANADYQVNFNNDQSSLIGFAALQNTNRSHYTGILPDHAVELQNHLENPPYGTSKVNTYNVGMQFNHKVLNFIGGNNVLTFGAEYILDQVFDEIPAYRFLVEQETKNLGLFIQSDWDILKDITLLTGLRLDKHNLIDHVVLSPRASILYKWADYTQLRLNYGAGFRAPQSFDTDLHIAFAGGGISRVALSPDLLPERSRSLSVSINYDKPADKYIYGFTLEAFTTNLQDAFYLHPLGEDEFGEVFEKRNGQSAAVKGVTLETRANYDQKIQLETGFTLQSSLFETKVEYIEGLEGIREFIRSPRDYGYASLNLMPNKSIRGNINYVYTGKMKVPHFAGAPNQEIDEIITSNPFHELGARLSYTFKIDALKTNLEFYLGAKNVFNEYQESFDIGKNRDSNFVYGPAQPRTWYIGLKLKS